MQSSQVPAAASLGAGARLREAVLSAGGSRGRSGHWLSPGPGAGPLLSDGSQAAYPEDQGSQSTRLLLVAASTWLFQRWFTPGEDVHWVGVSRTLGPAWRDLHTLPPVVLTVPLGGSNYITRLAEGGVLALRRRGKCLESHPLERQSQDTPSFTRCPKSAVSAPPAAIGSKSPHVYLSSRCWETPWDTAGIQHS